MAVIKCKMCGGNLNITEDSSVCECEYCGTKQTVPKADDEKKLTLFTRASRLLRNCEFDKASGVFETIVADFPEEAEAYWGLVLCKYGIEYVDDPATGKKVPTCHRSSFNSVEDDTNFEQACENADLIARRIYREEARQIETLRKRILEVSGKEEPYDIFISYKELDEDGERTIDSVIAQNIYKALINEGYRVFFSRISLEGKLGVEYEPYIFAALNSAKVMIVVGTDYDYFDAVWVKNEWSRFLKLIASGQQKTLIPVYKDMDPYDMPKELRNLAAQNMGKIGAMQDLLHGVEKLLGKTDNQTAPTADTHTDSGISAINTQTTAMLKRGFMMLEDREWSKADELFEKVLNNDAECGQAYWGKALAGAKIPNAEQYGSDFLFNRLKANRAEKTVTIPVKDIAVLAREADEKNILKDFSDQELNGLLTDLKLKPIQLQTAQQFFRSQKSKYTEPSALHALANSRDFDRASKYADDVVKQGEQAALKTFRECIVAAIQREEKKEAEAKRIAENQQSRAIATIRNRLQDISREYEKQRSAIEEERQKAEKLAEADYQAALRQHELDYRAAVAAQDAAYQKEVAAWEHLKQKYDENYDFALAETAKLKEKISQLETEKNNLTGLFTGRKRRELEDNIALLRKNLSEITVPDNPGDRPEKPSAVQKRKIPQREDFKAVIWQSGAFELREQIKCSLSPSCKACREVIEKLLGKKPGDEICFGSYPNRKGETSPIEWKVLAKENNRLLVISKYGIDCQQYNSTYTNVTWETCTLRTWLNGTFLKAAFSADEQKAILATTVDNSKSQGNSSWSTNGGNDTKDQIFLLSYAEAGKYFSSNEARICKPTAYAKAKGAYTDNSGNCWWWLRSPGSSQIDAAGVGTVGSLGSYSSVYDDDLVVRPAFWINLESDIF